MQVAFILSTDACACSQRSVRVPERFGEEMFGREAIFAADEGDTCVGDSGAAYAVEEGHVAQDVAAAVDVDYCCCCSPCAAFLRGSAVSMGMAPSTEDCGSVGTRNLEVLDGNSGGYFGISLSKCRFV